MDASEYRKRVEKVLELAQNFYVCIRKIVIYDQTHTIWKFFVRMNYQLIYAVPKIMDVKKNKRKTQQDVKYYNSVYIERKTHRMK